MCGCRGCVGAAMSHTGWNLDTPAVQQQQLQREGKGGGGLSTHAGRQPAAY
jgi:hypothetical protein